jgi:transcriptional regulator with XRE-family HTH domain
MPLLYNLSRGGIIKKRTLPLGGKNMIGARVTEAREANGMKQVELLSKLQTSGIDISIPALSLLEGQKRPVSDFELSALADILNVSVSWLMGRQE